MTQSPGKLLSKQRLTLVITFVLCIAPVAAALLLTSRLIDWRPVDLANHGELITPPARLRSIPFRDLEGREMGLDRLFGKWNLVFISEGRCSEACFNALRSMRHLQLALGKNVSRVQRVLMLAEPGSLVDSGMVNEYPRPLVLLGKVSDRRNLISQLGIPSDKEPDGQWIFVVDPQGNLMMRYPSTANFTGMVKDMQRLLKASLTG